MNHFTKVVELGRVSVETQGKGSVPENGMLPGNSLT